MGFNNYIKYTPEYNKAMVDIYSNLDSFGNNSGMYISTTIISDNEYDIIDVINERIGTSYKTYHKFVCKGSVISLIDVTDGSDIQVIKELMKLPPPDGFSFRYVFNYIFKSGDGIIKSNCDFIEN